jgi:hypothetical protein
MTITAAQLVLVGSTSGATLPSTVLLQSAGNISASGLDPELILNNTGSAARVWRILGSSTAGSIASFRIYDGTANASRLTIDTGGNVGIGTTSPTVPLTIAASSDAVRINSTGGGVGLYLNNSSANDVLIRLNNNSNNFWDIRNETTGSPLTFGYNGTQAMQLNNAGNMLLGTTSYSGQTSRFTIKKSGNIGTIYAEQLDSGGYNYNSRAFNNSGTFYHMQFEAGTTQVGSITSNGSNTTYGTGSDYRLKNDVAPMSGGLDKISSLKPVTWKWKSTGENGQGFLAHELAEICPEAVTGQKDAIDENGKPIYQMVDVSYLVATLTAAIQELKATVDAQAARIAALEGAQ